MRRHGGWGTATAADDAEEEDGHGRVQDHLQDRVDRHDEGAVLDVPAREVRPHEHHGDAPRQPDEDEPLPQRVLVGQKGPREPEHKQGGDDPVEGDGDGELGPDGAAAEGEGQGFEAGFAEDGVHHCEEADGEGEGHVREGAALEGRGGGGDEVAEEDAGDHGEEDPEEEEAVEEGEGLQGGRFGGGGGWGWGLLFGVGGWEGGWGDG